MENAFLQPGKEFKKKRRKTKTREKIIGISFGVINKLSEFVLFATAVGLVSMKPRALASGLARDLSQCYPQIDIKQWIEGIYQGRKKRWIDNDGALTKEGEVRLKSLFPKFSSERYWDKNWYIVNFDIPEKLHRKRDILREKLKALGFGMLQQSVWLSPVNFLGAVQKEVNALGIDQYVLPSKATEIGEEDSKILADRIWSLKDLNFRYKRFIEKHEGGVKKENFLDVVFEFLKILKKDPQLPIDLLPLEWYGKEAHRLICDLHGSGKFNTKFREIVFSG